MLPDSQHEPAMALQDDVGLSIPKHIGFNLRLPELCVGFREPLMSGAAMPKAPVDKHGDFCGSKHDVCSASNIL